MSGINQQLQNVINRLIPIWGKMKRREKRGEGRGEGRRREKIARDRRKKMDEWKAEERREEDRHKAKIK